MEVNQITKITICWELFEAGVPKSHIADRLCLSRETIHIWIREVESIGLNNFIEDYLNSKKGERAKRKIDAQVKNWIWDLRDTERDCCAQKIRKFLIDRRGVSLSPTTIYKVLSEKYKLRSKWKKNQVRGPIPRATKPREVIQMDTVDFGEVFAFTGIDIFTKEVEVKLFPSLTAVDGLNFLEYSFDKRYRHTNTLQTDGGPEFKAEFGQNAYRFADRLRRASPYKKNEQSYIESFNRSLRKECLGWIKYKQRQIVDLNQELENYLLWYHKVRPHMSLNMQTPNQFIQTLVSDI